MNRRGFFKLLAAIPFIKEIPVVQERVKIYDLLDAKVKAALIRMNAELFDNLMKPNLLYTELKERNPSMDGGQMIQTCFEYKIQTVPIKLDKREGKWDGNPL